MGFNNDGAEAVAARLARLRRTRAGRTVVIGVNIGKSRAADPDDTVALVVGSSSHAMHRVIGSVAVSLSRHSPVPLVIVP